MLTRSGWLLLGGGAVLVASGRVLGTLELFILGAICILLVTAAAAYTGLTRLSVHIAREVHPARVHAGTPARVDLRVENRGGRSSPVLALHDAVSGTRGAHLTVGPLPPGGLVRAAYRLPTERRGILVIGPLHVTMGDPFGLSRLRMEVTGPSDLTVYPHVDHVPAVPLSSGSDPMAGAVHPNALGRAGEDFYALRHYVVGDDLRRVHWAATARHDELMVRQDELPWQGRTTILLDVRRTAGTDEDLEIAISAAASLVVASARRGDLLRLLTTDGTDVPMAAGHAHVESMLEHLAVVEPCHELAFPRVVGRLARTTGGGALVAIVGRTTDVELSQIRQLRRTFSALHLVRFGASSTVDPSEPSASGELRIGAGRPFAEAWRRAITRRPVRSPQPRPTPTAGHSGVSTSAGEIDDEPAEDRWGAHERAGRHVTLPP
ncbi:MAG: DUF58 domain-containing protein [Acidimicrobiia bacterium]|nr:DUF58 domain-containing protein [Acidimicrobiia bacterium]